MVNYRGALKFLMNELRVLAFNISIMVMPPCSTTNIRAEIKKYGALALKSEHGSVSLPKSSFSSLIWFSLSSAR